MKRLLASILIFAVAILGARAVAPVNDDSDSVPTTLAQCFFETVAYNEELLELRKDVERAAGTKLEIRSRDLPQLSAGLEAGGRNGSLYGNGGPYALFTAQFSQRLLDTGIAPSWKRGEGEVVVAQQRLNAAVSDRLHEAQVDYLRAQQLEQLIAIYREVGQRLQNNITSEQQRTNAGSAGPRPLLEAKIQLLASQADLTSFQREEFSVRVHLAGLMQRPANQIPSPTELVKQGQTNIDWAEQERLALQRRSDLKFLRALIQITKEDRQTVEAGYFPEISLVGSGLFLPGKTRVYQATQIVEGQIPLSTEAREGVAATWQIIDNGQVTGASREIAGVQHEYEIILAKLEQDIPRSLARIRHSLEDADAQLAALGKSQQEADENLRLVESRISVGDATQLDFSDAQRNLLAVRRGIANATFEHNAALGELDWVTGRYLEFTQPAKAP
jgi:outer membrane protein TolC